MNYAHLIDCSCSIHAPETLALRNPCIASVISCQRTYILKRLAKKAGLFGQVVAAPLSEVYSRAIHSSFAASVASESQMDFGSIELPTSMSSSAFSIVTNVYFFYSIANLSATSFTDHLIQRRTNRGSCCVTQCTNPPSLKSSVKLIPTMRRPG